MSCAQLRYSKGAGAVFSLVLYIRHHLSNVYNVYSATHLAFRLHALKLLPYLILQTKPVRKICKLIWHSRDPWQVQLQRERSNWLSVPMQVHMDLGPGITCTSFSWN